MKQEDLEDDYEDYELDCDCVVANCDCMKEASDELEIVEKKLLDEYQVLYIKIFSLYKTLRL